MENHELQKLVEEISVAYFGREFSHQAYFNPRLRTTGGRYMLQTHDIQINRSYLDQIGLDEMIGIIKHELCHYHLHIEGRGYKHQDADFKKLLKKVGAPRFCSSLPNRSERRQANTLHVYACRNCSEIYRRKRTVNISRYVCGKCQGKLMKINV